MKKVFLFLGVVLIATVFVAGVSQTVFAQQRAQVTAPIATERPQLGELTLPYIGEATVEFAGDDEGGGTFTFSIPKPASVGEMQCAEIGWEFPMNPKQFPIQPRAGEDSVTIQGLTAVDVIGQKLYITMVGENKIRKFVFPYTATLAYGNDRFAMGRNGQVLRVTHEVVNDDGNAPVENCPGGSCSCGSGKCDACCSVGYHPSCTNCGGSGNCKCLRNRGGNGANIEIDNYQEVPNGENSLP